MTTCPAVIVAPRSPTNLCRNSFSLSSFISHLRLLVADPSGRCLMSTSGRRCATYGLSLVRLLADPGGDAGTVVDAEPLHRVAHVQLGGLLADPELAADLPVGVAGRDQTGHFQLPRGQSGGRDAVLVVGPDQARDQLADRVRTEGPTRPVLALRLGATEQRRRRGAGPGDAGLLGGRRVRGRALPMGRPRAEQP